MKKKPDFLLLAIMSVLLALGVLMIYSASSPECSVSAQYKHNPMYFAVRQLASILIGIPIFWLCQRIDLKKLEKFSMLGFPIAIGIVLLVLCPGIGVVINGSRRWIGAGMFMIQPAEFAKVLCVISIAGFLAKYKDKIKNVIPQGEIWVKCWSERGHGWDGFKKVLINLWTTWLTPYLRLLITIGFIALIIEEEPDLGTAASIVFVFLIMTFSGGARTWANMSVIGIGFLLVVGKLIKDGLDSYRVKRILAFINPWQDEQGWGYQNCQGLIAVGSGGLTGLGFGESRQKFFYLPERHTDFIFAIISEELGLIGGILILVAFAIILYRGFKIASETNDLFLRMLAVGCASMLSLQAAMNIAVVIGAMPTTGIPLPFISYGGSSILASMATMGLLFNVSKYTSEKGRCWELVSENEYLAYEHENAEMKKQRIQAERKAVREASAKQKKAEKKAPPEDKDKEENN